MCIVQLWQRLLRSLPVLVNRRLLCLVLLRRLLSDLFLQETCCCFVGCTCAAFRGAASASVRTVLLLGKTLLWWDGLGT